MSLELSPNLALFVKLKLKRKQNWSGKFGEFMEVTIVFTIVRGHLFNRRTDF